MCNFALNLMKRSNTMKILSFVKRTVILTMLLSLPVFYQPFPLLAEEQSTTSLLEYYNETDKETLDRDTEEMATKLKGIFKKPEIVRTENELEFSKYYTSFKNLILYANKIASYAEYKENIRFGRDQEIYQKLPLEGKMTEDRRNAIDEKYSRLETITKEELLTYQDMAEASFISCEFYLDQQFWGDKFFSNPRFKESMTDVFQSDLFKKYEQEKRPLLMKSNPDYVNRIDRLIASWRKPLPEPTSPLIDPEIVERL